MLFITIKKFLHSRIRFFTIPFIGSNGTRLKTSLSFIDEKFKQIDKSPFLQLQHANPISPWWIFHNVWKRLLNRDVSGYSIAF